MMAAIDLTTPTLPSMLWYSTNWGIHGASVSNDGRTLYSADTGNYGLGSLDVSQIQDRVPNPQVTEISRLTWPEVSISQNAAPFTVHGHNYLVETDEYGGGNDTTPVGAARIIDIEDPVHPFVVSRLRLAGCPRCSSRVRRWGEAAVGLLLEELQGTGHAHKQLTSNRS